MPRLNEKNADMKAGAVTTISKLKNIEVSLNFAIATPLLTLLIKLMGKLNFNNCIVNRTLSTINTLSVQLTTQYTTMEREVISLYYWIVCKCESISYLALIVLSCCIRIISLNANGRGCSKPKSTSEKYGSTKRKKKREEKGRN